MKFLQELGDLKAVSSVKISRASTSTAAQPVPQPLNIQYLTSRTASNLTAAGSVPQMQHSQ
jgi:hypothetical protein